MGVAAAQCMLSPMNPAHTMGEVRRLDTDSVHLEKVRLGVEYMVLPFLHY